MPYTLTIDGMDEITAMLSDLDEDAQGIAALALYEGAGIVADEIEKQARSIKTSPFKYAKGGEQRDPSPEEKQILIDEGAAGIAKFEKTGNYVGTAVGYNRTGYAMVSWNHMKGNGITNYKVKNMKIVWSGKAYLKKGSDGHYQRNRGAGGLTNAKPVAVIANAINSGTSFMKKQPFIRKAVSKSKQRAEDAIRDKVQELVEKKIKTA